MKSPYTFDELRARIEQVVELRSEPLRLGNCDFEWFRVADPDQLLQVAANNTEHPAEELDPFWAATWRAAIGLDQYVGQYIEQHGCPARVLELGCGSGQAGVGAAARGASVTLTDAVELALQVAELNAWPVRERTNFQILRWDQDQLGEEFPLILGSDLVYDPQLFPLLDLAARQHLEPGGVLLLSEPHRHTGDKFSTWSRSAGWNVAETDVDLNDGRVPIRIFACRL